MALSPEPTNTRSMNSITEIISSANIKTVNLPIHSSRLPPKTQFFFGTHVISVRWPTALVTY